MHQLRRSLNRSPDPWISAAATHRVGHNLINLVVVRLGIGFQQGARGHDHTRLAITALGYVFLDPGALTRMIAVPRQAFDRSETAAGCGRAWDLAGPYRLPVVQDGTRPTNTDTAPEFRAG